MHLAVANHPNTFSDELVLNPYSRGMGGMGLPGDLSSQSRFVRVSFVKMNSLSGDSEEESVSQFFHILGSVDQQRGCCKLGEDKYEITLYTSCCNTDKGIYYYNTYDNHQSAQWYAQGRFRWRKADILCFGKGRAVFQTELMKVLPESCDNSKDPI